MKLSLYIARKIIANKQPSFSGFVIKIAAAATAVSVATMVVTLSMVNGFQFEVSEKVYSFWGHVRVQNLEPMRSGVAEETPMETSAAVVNLLQRPGIIYQHAFASRSIVLRSQQQFEGVVLKGVSASFSSGPFSRFVTDGSMLYFPDSGYSQQLLLGKGIAQRLQVKTGDTISAFYLRQGEDVQTRRLVISGIYKTGIEEYDYHFGMVDLRFLQRLNQWNKNEIGGYEIWLQDPSSADAFAKNLSSQLPQGIMSVPITRIYPNIFDWLNIQNQTKQITIGVMLAVAIINLITCLLILVMERSRMVALLSTMGMAPTAVRQVFWYYAAWIAGVGVTAGLALALGLLGIQWATGIIKMDEATYYVDRMPVKIIWWQVLAVALGSFAICVAALRIPLAFLRKISIINALKFR